MTRYPRCFVCGRILDEVTARLAGGHPHHRDCLRDLYDEFPEDRRTLHHAVRAALGDTTNPSPRCEPSEDLVRAMMSELYGATTDWREAVGG